MGELLKILYALFPLLVGALLHGLCMKFDLIKVLAIPIDGGMRLGTRPLFGPNKTIRGIVTVATGCAMGWCIEVHLMHHVGLFRGLEPFPYDRINCLVFGLEVGLAAMSSELPNSFAKRRLGIAPGQSAPGVLGPVFYLLDQVDLLAGFWLVMCRRYPPTPWRVALSVAVVLCVHQLICWLGYALGMRASPR